jgi:hypothetical protein
VLADLGGGYLHVRQIGSYFGRPGCMQGRRYTRSPPGGTGRRVEGAVALLLPWIDATTRMVEEGEARGAEGRRRHPVVEAL